MADKRTAGWILMIVGAIAWLAGELIGVHSKRSMDTTSELIWWLQRQRWIGPTIRALVLAFTISLVAHFQFGTPLVP